MSPESLLVSVLRLVVRYPSLLPLAVILGVATYYDVKHREIPMGLLVAGAPGIAVGLALFVLLGGLSHYQLPTALVVVVVGASLVATSYVLARRGQLGSGDVPMIALLVVGAPYTVEVGGIQAPVVALVLVLGMVYVLIEVILNAVHNAGMMPAFRRLTADSSAYERLYYFLTSRVMTLEEFRRSRFYFPVKYEGFKRYVARVGTEPLDPSEHQVAGDVLLAEKGTPFVALLFTGLLFTILWIVIAGVPC